MRKSNLNDITKQELEKIVQGLIDGKYSRQEIVKEWRCDYRTLEKVIMELEHLNLDLYKKYIKKFPYKPHDFENLDISAVIFEMIYKGLTIKQTAKKYNMTDTWLKKLINKAKGQLEEEDPELLKYYELLSKANKARKKLTYILKSKEEKIDFERFIINREKDFFHTQDETKDEFRARIRYKEGIKTNNISPSTKSRRRLAESRIESELRNNEKNIEL